MAVTLVAADLERDLGLKSERAVQLAGVVKALVDGYAPQAPEDISNEAARRVAGFLRDMAPSYLSKVDAGQLTLEYFSGVRSPLRHSGAMAILSPFKRRRAGAIG